MNVIFLLEVFENKIVVDNKKCNLIKISNKHLIGYIKEISTYVFIFLSHNEKWFINNFLNRKCIKSKLFFVDQDS